MLNKMISETQSKLYEQFIQNNTINPELFDMYNVKRGLRNADGTGVMAGITNICNVHGYIVSEGEKQAIDGELIYRGYNINDLVANVYKENRFGFEEIIYLLLMGDLPTKDELEKFNEYLIECRALPEHFFEDVILKNPSKNIMNMLSRSVLALYSYEENPEDINPEKEMKIAISLISKLPIIMVDAYQVKRRQFDKKSMVVHPLRENESIAESILSTLRPDRKYTPEEAQLLDLLLMLHAEHGGGNNSTFTCRVLTSSGTDAYSAYSAAIGSLKGPKHGGANIKVMEMLEYIKENVRNWNDEGEVADYMVKLLKKEAGDKSGLIYGMGHAVYTISDPRAIILKKHAMELAQDTEYEAEFKLLETVERLTPKLFAEVKGDVKTVCANVDMYSGLVYKMLRIPSDLFTPLFAISRMPGWCAHRFEEIMTGKRIIRPAYKSVMKRRNYIPLNER